MDYFNVLHKQSGNRGDKAVKLWRRLVSTFSQRHAPCAWCRVHVDLTGEAACSPIEVLTTKLVGGRKHASFHWLEDQLADALYQEERRNGAWATDIGIWGPDAFRKEAFGLLTNMRPEFGSLAVVDLQERIETIRDH